jgi:hypothetical protein
VKLPSALAAHEDQVQLVHGFEEVPLVLGEPQLLHTTERRRGRKGYALREELLRFQKLLAMLLTGLRPFLGETLEVQPPGQTPKFVDLILEVEMEETS